MTIAATERDRDAGRKRTQRAAAKEVVIPPCEDWERRTLLEEDDFEWLRWYFHELFWYAFTSQHREMIVAIASAITFGGDQALAASRGEGKTKIAEKVLTKYTLQGRLKFPVLFGATGSAACDCLDSIKYELERNDRLLADYPEVCVPVRALENTPNRAHYQLVSGVRHDNGEPFEQASSKFSWCGQQIIFPNVPGSPSAGAIIATRGLDAAVRGLNKLNRRPDFAVIDDPDTEETASSEEQAAKLEKRIDRAIAGLGGQQRSIGRVMLTTLQNRKCVSYKYTDPVQKPSWKGKRFRFLVKPPERMDLWDEYVLRRQENLQSGDDFARGAHAFYLENRADMDAGAEVANRHRFNGQVLPDGTQLEVSSLQRYYNEVARIGPEAVATEYDNDPPADENFEESSITANLIRARLRTTAKMIVPSWATKLTAGIDVAKRALHWVVAAFGEGATATVIDYGVAEVHSTAAAKADNEEAERAGVEKAIVNALLTWRDESLGTPYLREDGTEVPLTTVLVDSGWYDTAAINFVKQAGGNVFRASKGFGQSEAMTPYKPPEAHTNRKLVGNHWHLSLQEAKGYWLVALDADYWKRWVHDRFLTPLANEDGTPYRGSLALFASESRTQHLSYAKHLTAETEVEEFVKGKGLKRLWKKTNRNNHYFDATYMACAAASLNGIELLPKPPAPPSNRPKPVADSGRRTMQRRTLSFRR